LPLAEPIVGNPQRVPVHAHARREQYNPLSQEYPQAWDLLLGRSADIVRGAIVIGVQGSRVGVASACRQPCRRRWT
jgi:hypothetical protein